MKMDHLTLMMKFQSSQCDVMKPNNSRMMMMEISECEFQNTEAMHKIIQPITSNHYQ